MYSDEFPTSPEGGLMPLQRPSYSPADYHKVQDAISDVLDDLRQIAPALNDAQRETVLNITGARAMSVSSDGRPIQYDVDQVTEQYRMVQIIREKVLSAGNIIAENASAKDLSALVNAINSTISLFMRHQTTMDHLKEMRIMREATILALKGLPEDVISEFFRRLEELRAGLANE